MSNSYAWAVTPAHLNEAVLRHDGGLPYRLQTAPRFGDLTDPRGLRVNDGEDKTKPVPNVKWLCEQGEHGGIIVSTSKPIPATGAEADKDV